MMSRVAPLAVVAVVAVALAASAGARAATIVVLPIGIGGTDDPALTSEVRGALTSLGDVQAAAKTAEAIAAAKSLGIACNQAEASCLAQLGGLAGGDLVVGGAAIPVTVSEGAVQLTLRLVNAATGSLVRTIDLVIPGPSAGNARVQALRLITIRLVAPDRERATITVLAPAGVAVQVDGVPRGNAPLKAPIAVKPGRHDVYGALHGYISDSETVDVSLGDDATVSLDLRRDADGDGEPDTVVSDAPPEDEQEVEGRAAITALEVTGGGALDAKLARAIALSVAVEMEKRESLDVIRLDEVQRSLEPSKAVMLACHEQGCNTMIGKELGIEDLVVVEVEVAPDTRLPSKVTLSSYSGEVGHHIATRERAVDGSSEADVAEAIGEVVHDLYPGRLRPGVPRGLTELVVEDTRGRGPLPPWVFWTSLAATGAAATAAGAFAAWAAVDGEDNNVVDLAMWTSVGATAALVAADVAVALSTDWGRR